MTRTWQATIFALSVMLTTGPTGAQAPAPLPSVPAGITVRDGYELSVAQAELRGPRFLELGPDGTLYVSFPRTGEIKACRDGDGDGYYEAVTTFVDGRRLVHGLCWYEGWLWFSQSGSIHRARDTDGDGAADELVTVIAEGQVPGGGGHWWRSLLVHQGRLYTSIGDAANISDQTDTERQKIWSFDLEGGDKQLWCSGIRNTEKLVVRPGTEEIWGMDHGSDWFGRELEQKASAGQPITDDNPPEEMNHYLKGAFYGHPFIVGNRLPRYEYLNRPDIVALAARTTVPAWAAPAHWAANSMEFYTGDRFPSCRGDAFVAFHGSWNRSRKGGYQVTRVLFDRGRPYGALAYVEFLDGQAVRGRPVDTVMAADGSLLISDDYGHRIYRLRYTGDGR